MAIFSDMATLYFIHKFRKSLCLHRAYGVLKYSIHKTLSPHIDRARVTSNSCCKYTGKIRWQGKWQFVWIYGWNEELPYQKRLAFGVLYLYITLIAQVNTSKQSSTKGRSADYKTYLTRIFVSQFLCLTLIDAPLYFLRKFLSHSTHNDVPITLNVIR